MLIHKNPKFVLSLKIVEHEENQLEGGERKINHRWVTSHVCFLYHLIGKGKDMDGG